MHIDLGSPVEFVLFSSVCNRWFSLISADQHLKIHWFCNRCDFKKRESFESNLFFWIAQNIPVMSDDEWIVHLAPRNVSQNKFCFIFIAFYFLLDAWRNRFIKNSLIFIFQAIKSLMLWNKCSMNALKSLIYSLI